MLRHSGSQRIRLLAEPRSVFPVTRVRARSLDISVASKILNLDRTRELVCCCAVVPISNPKTLPARARDSPTSPTRARLSNARQNYPRHTRLSFTTKRHHVRCYHEHHRRARRQGTRRGRSRARDGARTRSRLTRLWTLTREKDAAIARHRRGVAAPRASDARVSLDPHALC